MQKLFRSAAHCYFSTKVHLRYSTEFEYHSAESHLVTATPRQIDMDSTWILHWYVEDQISTNFHVISAYFFDIISMVQKSMLFPRTFFDVISLVEKPTLFPRTFFNVISMVEKSTFFPHTLFDVMSMVEKSTLFPHTLFDVISTVAKSTLFPRTFIGVISLVQKSTLFPRTFFDVICLVEICTLFLLTSLDVILMGKNSRLCLVSCKLMKTFEEDFPVFVTLNSWLLQDCSLYVFQVNPPGVAQVHWNLTLTTSTTAKRTIAS